MAKGKKPLVVVTRKLPDTVETRMRELFDTRLNLDDKPDAASSVSAKLQHGVLATVRRCKDGWCRLVGDGFDGWIEQPRLWGVYPNEKLD